MQTTIPSKQTPSSLEQCLGRTYRGARVTPLARAALDNGIAFEDVQAYCEAQGETRPDRWAAWYEALIEPVSPTTPALDRHVEAMRLDTALDAALARSVLAEGSIAHARLWWLGVL